MFISWKTLLSSCLTSSFRIFYWQLSVLWSQWHGHRPRVIRCIKPSHFISLSSHIIFSKVFSFLFFMTMCFSLFLFDVLLFSFFTLFSPLLVISSCFQLFCLPSFWQKIYSCFISSFSICFRSFSFSVSSSFFFNFSLFTHFWIFFFHSKNLSLLLCTCFSLFSFFFKKKLLHFSICPLVCSLFSVVYIFFGTFFRILSVFFFLKQNHCFDLLSFFFWRNRITFLSFFYLLKIVLLVFPSFLFMFFFLFFTLIFFCSVPCPLFSSSLFVSFFNKKTSFSPLFYLPFLITKRSYFLC